MVIREKAFDQGAITERARVADTLLVAFAEVVVLEPRVAAVELESWGAPAMGGAGVP